MYPWLFRMFPGPLWVRILFAALIVVLVLVGLFVFAFPWFAHVVSLEESTVGA